MTARALLERAGCYAIELARAAGISDRYWNTMINRDSPIKTARSPERMPKMIEAAKRRRDEITALIRDMEKANRE